MNNRNKILIYPEKDFTRGFCDIKLTVSKYGYCYSHLFDLIPQGDSLFSYFVIPAHSSCLIWTEEIVSFPSDRLATIHPITKLAAKGFVIQSTRVEPNWTGPLVIPVMNSSKVNMTFEIGKPFIYLLEHQLPENVDYFNSDLSNARLDLLNDCSNGDKIRDYYNHPDNAWMFDREELCAKINAG